MNKLNVNKLMSMSEFINEAAKGKQIVVSYSGKFQPFKSSSIFHKYIK